MPVACAYDTQRTMPPPTSSIRTRQHLPRMSRRQVSSPTHRTVTRPRALSRSPSIVVSSDAYEHPARDAAPVIPQVVLRSLFPLLSQSARHASRLSKMPRPFGGTHFMHLALHGMQPVLVVVTACGMGDIGYLPAAAADPSGIVRKTKAPAAHSLRYLMYVPHSERREPAYH